jgi:cyclase
MRIGSQALVASLPLGIKEGILQWHSHILQAQRPANETLPRIFEERIISEALVIDWQHEGARNGFDFNILSQFPIDNLPLIAFGGLSEVSQIREILDMPKVAAVGVGNFLNYREHSVQKYKECLASTALRAPEYQNLISK